MARTRPNVVVQHLRKLAEEGSADALPDAELLARFAAQRDDTAFAALVQRHGPMVLGVCRSVLRHEQDAEDGFQATFLTLARKAHSIRQRQSVAAWLHEVAYHVAVKSRARGQRQQVAAVVPEAGAEKSEPLLDLTLREAQRILHEELRRLPEHYRTPLVLCYLEARTQEEAARQLGCTEAALHGRLHRARQRLRTRLTRRGLTLTSGLALPLLPQHLAAAVPVALLQTTVRTVLCAAPAIPVRVAALSAGVLRSAALARIQAAALVVLALAALGVTAGVFGEPTPAVPQQAQQLPQPKPLPLKKGRPVDLHGDPLPPRAIARMGTVRLRHVGAVYAVAYTSDGKLLVSLGGDTVRFWDAVTGREVRQFQGEVGGGMQLALSPDGKLLIAGKNSPIRLWDTATGKEIGKLGGYIEDGKKPEQRGFSEQWRRTFKEPPFEGHPLYVRSVAFSPDGKTLASAGGELLLWDLGKKKLLRTLQPATKAVSLVAFSPDGKTLAAVRSGNPAVGDQDTMLSFWDVAQGEELRRFQAHPLHIEALAFSPDGKSVATGSRDETVRLWDATSGKLLRTLDGHDGNVKTVAFSPNGKILAAVAPAAIHLWDPATGARLRQVTGHPGPLWSAAFSPDGKTLASASAGNGAVRLWEMKTGAERVPASSHDVWVSAVAFAPDGKTLATTGGDCTLRLWQTFTGKEVRTLDRDRAPYGDVVFAHDGRSVVAGTSETAAGYRIGIWDAATGELVRRFGKYGQAVSRLAFSADGKVLAAAGGESLHTWEMATGQELRRFDGHARGVYGVTLSRDGKLLAAVDGEGTVLLWDTAAGASSRKWRGEKGGFSQVALAPDGWLLAAGTQDGWVRIWATATGAEVGRFKAHDRGVHALAFGPTGKTLASGGPDRVVRLWEVATWKELSCFEGHRGESMALAWSTDGTLVASGSYDGTALVWDVARR